MVGAKDGKGGFFPEGIAGRINTPEGFDKLAKGTEDFGNQPQIVQVGVCINDPLLCMPSAHDPSLCSVRPAYPFWGICGHTCCILQAGLPCFMKHSSLAAACDVSVLHTTQMCSQAGEVGFVVVDSRW